MEIKMTKEVQTNWQYLYGEPSAFGVYKKNHEDFKVIEDLGFELTQEGEHLFLQIEKTNYNTLFIVDQLAKWAGIAPRLISYAGLKDKQAVTTQWFSLHLPGKVDLDLTTFQLEGVRILRAARHHKKLRIGALKTNHFYLILRDISDMNAVIERLQKIQKTGLPNYFGEQRFGINEQNIHQALLWANGEIQVKDRKKRSFYLSAIRSYLFNHVVSARVDAHCFDQVMLGDIVQLAGSNSWFNVNTSDLKDVQKRIATFDVSITAPMMGDNGCLTTFDALEFEHKTILKVFHHELLTLFKKERIETARRSILTLPENLTWQELDASTLQLQFTLPAGNYATSLVRELIHSNPEK